MKRKLRSKRSPSIQRKGSPRPKRNKTLFGWLSLSMTLIVIVAGCGGDPPSTSLPQKVNVPSAAPKKDPPKVEEKKEMQKKEEAVYSYNPAGKPDPFKPFIQLTSIREGSRSGPLTPLQKYEVSQLKLVAIISTPEGNIALVEDSSGKGYFLKKGTWIGKNDGKVTKILKDKVIVEEVYQDIFGHTKTNEMSIFLHRIEEGGES